MVFTSFGRKTPGFSPEAGRFCIPLYLMVEHMFVFVKRFFRFNKKYSEQHRASCNACLQKAVRRSFRLFDFYELIRRPDAEKLLLLARYYDVSVDYILGLTDNPRTAK